MHCIISTLPSDPWLLTNPGYFLSQWILVGITLISLIVALLAILGLKRQLVLLDEQLRLSRQVSDNQIAATFLQARADIQLALSREYAEAWTEWDKAKRSLNFLGGPTNVVDPPNNLVIAGRRLCVVLWKQFSFLQEGLFDPHRLTLFSRFRVDEFANLRSGSPADEMIRQVLLRECEGFGDAQFFAYIKKLDEAGEAYAFACQQANPPTTVRDCKKAESIVRDVIGEAVRVRDLHLRVDIPRLRDLPDSIGDSRLGASSR